MTDMDGTKHIDHNATQSREKPIDQQSVILHLNYYSRLLITRTFRGNRNRFEFAEV